MSTGGRGLILIVDDDAVFRDVLARALRRRGYDTLTASGAEDARQQAPSGALAGAVVDLKMTGASGLTLMPWLRQRYPEAPILMLTGFASIATAVDAIKLGATQYLAKPADADEVLKALFAAGNPPAQVVPEQRLSVDRLEWEHIHRVLADHGGNVSATARALNMHRRTLQRKLGKKPVAK